MSRRRQVAFAIFACLLVVSAAPGAAAQSGDGTLVVGSSHSTDSEFANQKLIDLTTTGTGDSASVTLQDLPLLEDSFEDGDIAEYSGATDGWTTTTSVAKSGSTSVTRTSDNAHRGIYRTDVSVASGKKKTVTGWSYYDGTGEIRGGVYLATDSGAGYIAYVNKLDGRLIIGEVGGPQTYSTSLTATQVQGFDAGWYEVSLTHDGDTLTASVKDASGTTLVSDTATDATYDPTHPGVWGYDDEETIDVLQFGAGEEFLSESTPTQYVGTHEVSGAEQAAINIEQLSNISVEATVRTDGGTTLATDTITSTGNHTLNLSTASSSQLETVLNVSVTGENPQLELADESILFTNHGPELDNASATPEDGSQLTSKETTLSVDVSDPTFDTVQGDELTATFYVDGDQVGTDTTTSNGSVSTTVSPTGGEHTWSVEVTDEHGATVSSETFSFKTPSQISIRPVNDPDSLINNSSSAVTVRFFSTDGEAVIERTTTNGTIDLSGSEFDPTRKFVVYAEVDGYHARTIILDSLYQQQSVYLLNDSLDSVNVEFLLDDATGRFSGSQDTELIIQRALTVNNSTSWRVVIGDEISASKEAPVTLQQGSRYRLIVRNSEEQRVLGQYLATSDQPNEVLPIGEVDIQGEVYEGIAFGASLQEVEGQPTFRYILRDLNGSTQTLSVELLNRTNNESIYSVNTTDPPKTLVETVPLDNVTMDGQYRVEWSAELANGEVRSGEVILGDVPEVGCLGLGTGVCSLAGYLAILMTFGLVSIKDPAGGVGAATIVASGLTIAGVVPLNSVQIGLAGGLAIVMYVGGAGR